MSHLALSIVVAVIASLQFSLGVASAVQDNTLVNIRQTFNIVPYDYNPGSRPGPGSSLGTSTTVDPEVQAYYRALERFYSQSGNNFLSYLITGDYGSSNELTKVGGQCFEVYELKNGYPMMLCLSCDTCAWYRAWRGSWIKSRQTDVLLQVEGWALTEYGDRPCTKSSDKFIQCTFFREWHCH